MWQNGGRRYAKKKVPWSGGVIVRRVKKGMGRKKAAPSAGTCAVKEGRRVGHWLEGNRRPPEGHTFVLNLR